MARRLEVEVGDSDDEGPGDAFFFINVTLKTSSSFILDFKLFEVPDEQSCAFRCLNVHDCPTEGTR